jgi:hypothetical protein
MAKDYEDDVSLFEELLKEYEEEEDAEEVGDPVSGDNINVIRQQVQSGGGDGGGGFLKTILPIAAKIGMGYLTGGASAAGGSTFASGFEGAGMAGGFKEGGQIKKKTKKKKRVVRGVGAAKRGYGKATYSNKMY